MGRRTETLGWGWLAAALCLGGCADTGPEAAILRVGGAVDAGASAPQDAAASDAGAVAAEPAKQASADAALELDAGAIDDAAMPPTMADAGSEPGPLSAYEGCLPGVYFGSFSGQIGLLPALLGPLASSSIRGDISIRVSLASAGTLLVVDEGTVKGSDQAGNPINAVVSGVVDCKSGVLRSGTLSQGHYVRNGSDTPFTGDVAATYTAGPPTLSGTWNTAGGLEGASGVFSAVLRAQ